MPKKSFTFQKRSPDPAPPTTSPDISQFIAGHSMHMTRKTIALPQAAFLRVKIEAAKRGIPASRLWGEIVDAYFKTREE
jgi:predicted DNA binding CopG/RHH family protein